MQPASGISQLWLVWTLCSTALTLLGMFVLYKGVRPKRRGTTPFCRNCEYNLTGLPLKPDDPESSAYCPECGHELGAPAAIITGERHRRRGLIIAGAIGALLGGAPLTLSIIAGVRAVDWYQYKPTGWVLGDLETGSLVAERAIERRLKTDSLSTAHVSRLIELCLAEQRRRSTRGITKSMMQWMSEFHITGKLSAAQLERFDENSVQIIKFEARPTVIVGRECPVRLQHTVRYPFDLFDVNFVDRTYYVLQHEVTWVDGEILSKDRYMTTGSLSWSEGASSWSIRIDKLGRHQIAVDFTVLLFANYETWRRDETPFHTRRVTVEAECEVVADELADPIRMVSSPEFAAAVLTGISINNRSSRDVTTSRHLIVLDVKWRPNQPVPQAYDVFVRFNDSEVRIGSASIDRNRGSSSTLCQADAPDGLPAQFDVLLRSSADVARKTVDFLEIWDGDLLFRDVNAEYLDSEIREHSPTLIPRHANSP